MVASYITKAKQPRPITIHKSKQIPLSDNNVTIKLTCTSEKKTKKSPKSHHQNQTIYITKSSSPFIAPRQKK